MTTPCQRAEGCVCLHCPAGQEPSMACSELEVTDVTAECRDCPSDTFSDGHDPELCRPHTACETLNRQLLAAGTSHSDAACGACLPGFHSETTQKSSPLQACVTSECSRVFIGHRHFVAGVSAPLGSGVGVTNATAARSSENAEYAVYALAPVFCVMGLLGIFICNLLKKKGYTCTPEKEAAHNDTPQKDGNPFPCIVENSNEDTISVLVRLISEKTGMSPLLSPEPLKFQSLPRLCSHQHHLHTINGLVPHSGFCCSRCSQKKWPKLLLRPTPLFVDANKTAHTPVKPPSTNEGIVLSVGRFQVAQIQESKPVSISTTSTEGRDTDLVEPAEGMSFLGMASLSKAPSPHAADRT
uniref:TNFR-Cys domain-containing protein n=1 Tax=Electrophorus electricus TaxID=8005 RepID=A0A4W4HEU8_ELEEL